ncbi:MAG TPA: outer membrane protein assembly factor BamA [Chthoniobacter sp.]|jgi:outer membrane protein insertion porin family
MNFRKFIPVLVVFGVLAVDSASLSLHAQTPVPPAPASAPNGPIVRSIEVQYAGASTVGKEKLLANMRTRVGKPYSETAVEEDIRNLYKTGNIANVRIFGEQVPDGVKVIVVVQSKAKITEVRIVGATRVKESQIRKKISVKPGDILDEASLEQDRQKILKLYNDKGFSEVDVQYHADVNDEAGTAVVTFNVNEGGKLIIRNVKFEGNASIKSADLFKVTKTRPKRIQYIFSNGGKLNSETLDADVASLKDKYLSMGYLDVVVNPPRVDRQGDEADITFVVHEGAQFHVGKVTYNGAKVFTIDQITKGAKIKAGAIYSPQAVRADIKSIQDLYGARGYIDMEAKATTNEGPGDTMDVAFDFDEGAQSYLEHINITGNNRTKDKVIRREFAIQPGDVFSMPSVETTKARLMNTKYFSKVEAYPEDTLIPGRKDLNVLVDEQRTGSFNFGAGFSSIDSLLGFAEITQTNFDITRWPYFTGGGQHFRIRAQYGVERKDFTVSLTEPYFLDQEIAVGTDLFYNEASFTSNEYSERHYGFDITGRKRLTQFLSAKVEYRLEDSGIFDVSDTASTDITQYEHSRLKSQISTTFTYDTRDSVFLTRKGERIDLTAYVAGGFLGGNTDIYGFDLVAAKYFSLPYDGILILNGEVATVSTWAGGADVPLWDRLYLGGANNLRGFKFRDVGPKDSSGEPIGGDSLARFTVEYTIPIIDKVRGAVFYDVGIVNPGEYSFTTSDINSDVGFGVRLDLPIGPIRLDLGFPLQKDQFSTKSPQFNFNIGYQF